MKKAIIAVIASVVFLTAGTVYQGNDFSYVNNGQAIICDRERDFRDARVEYQVNTSGIVHIKYDSNGADAGCGVTQQYNRVGVHWTCESIFCSRGSHH